MVKVFSQKKNFSKIYKILKKEKNKNIFLTGGKSIIELYIYFKEKKFFDTENNFFLTDERIVTFNNLKKTNSYLLKKKLNIRFRHFENLYLNNNFKPQKFIDKINKKNFHIDYLFLSFGNDGHIASVFKINNIIKKNYRYTSNPNHEFKRFTISEKLISKSKNTFLIIKDKNRYELYKKMISRPNSSPISILKNYFLVLLF